MAEERQQEGLGAGGMAAEQEIRVLEQRLEEKKRALAEQGGAAQPEKEVFREVVREHIEHSGADIADRSFTNHGTADIAKKSGMSQEAAKHEEELHALVARALSGSIADAVDKAYRESPYLLDALHDRLVDEYYDKLVALRKIDAW
ncbi:MAG: hypothetical protein A3B34_02985 [Candidatus Sungbacteria bacterium RIFCSPLOWO2_01_FULL_54_21]|uniref:Uncharacterized protein n=2 Tax=Candidatus Sungiibacteriota TaxID=1817917 RepID=A0A1G2L6Y3_9BACT|nr:MAG: hypothetical protein A2679_03790 [Candidatus Sungbacteria bacterium RIFCSPHIGHO2_01_FULL_54_26]OHA02596.1 MAG: hypothetical protein A3C92_03050 [Candidatus Sungbacteria bacterium RIFCSPHIGHO2_02_FULL_53_17]OHA07395.1 MAG: hypothetical protein A3B34_02985 [Candidatus Sungbacteria bacterium RIFCSPLOWO2_01_FULL_54_21]